MKIKLIQNQQNQAPSLKVLLQPNAHSPNINKCILVFNTYIENIKMGKHDYLTFGSNRKIIF